MTIDTIDALTLAREMGGLTPAITNASNSAIVRVADWVLITAARKTMFRSGATATRLAQLTIVNCVFVAVAQRTHTESQADIAS